MYVCVCDLTANWYVCEREKERKKERKRERARERERKSYDLKSKR